MADEEESWDLTRPLEPGICFCRCGRQMQVKAIKIREHSIPKGVGTRLVRDLKGDSPKVKQALQQFEGSDWWVLAYKCQSCGSSMTSLKDKFTEKEAIEMAAKGNNEQEKQPSERQNQ